MNVQVSWSLSGQVCVKVCKLTTRLHPCAPDTLPLTSGHPGQVSEGIQLQMNVQSHAIDPLFPPRRGAI